MGLYYPSQFHILVSVECDVEIVESVSLGNEGSVQFCEANGAMRLVYGSVVVLSVGSDGMNVYCLQKSSICNILMHMPMRQPSENEYLIICSCVRVKVLRWLLALLWLSYF
jgi:hypothetical protein